MQEMWNVPLALRFCTKMKPEQYAVGDFGLFHAYDPVLFCLLSRTNMAFFPYEEKTSIKKLHTISHIEQYREALKDQRVLDWLHELPCPPEFKLETILEPNLDTIMELRLLQWRKHYRGRLSDNVVQFRSSLTKEEEAYLTDALNRILKVH